jgi:hypothetical protein
MWLVHAFEKWYRHISSSMSGHTLVRALRSLVSESVMAICARRSVVGKIFCGQGCVNRSENGDMSEKPEYIHTKMVACVQNMYK